MNDAGGQHTNPFEEALSRGAQHAAQLTSLAAAVAQVTMQRRAVRKARQEAANEQQARALEQQERDTYDQARLGWAPAHDPRWLAQADLPATAHTWAAAASYADTDPGAAAALRKCEDRLRRLHPYAMARYDRLRADGQGLAEAMREAAPLFAHAPTAHTSGPAPTRPTLAPSADSQPDETAGGSHPPDPVGTPGEQTERRAEQIAARLQAQARASGRDEFGPTELSTVLETVTNLPPDVVERISGRVAKVAPAKAANTASVNAAQLAAVSFPHTATEAVAAASTSSAAPRASSTALKQARRPGRHL